LWQDPRKGRHSFLFSYELDFNSIVVNITDFVDWRLKDNMAIKKKEMRIKIIKDGPYRVTGGLPLYEQIIVTDEAGHTRELIDKKEEYPLNETYYPVPLRCI
jgi:hypothetical protein